MNRSPWLAELDEKRVVTALGRDIETDIAVVGGGIAGIATAFFLLTHTDKRVTMFEKGRIAHGATGHNAGMVLAEFEREFYELAKEYRPALVADLQEELESGWELIEQLRAFCSEPPPLSRIIGYGGIETFEGLMEALEKNAYEQGAGFSQNDVLVADDASFLTQIPDSYDGLYRIVSRAEVCAALEAPHSPCVAVESRHFGVMNSALLTERLAGALLSAYPGRFALYEKTPIHKVVLKDNDALLDAGLHTVAAERVVLCTNGFEHLTILNVSGLDIDTKFHHAVSGTVGFMTAHALPEQRRPGSWWYFGFPQFILNEAPVVELRGMEPFVYVSQRPRPQGDSLIAVGGPELHLPNRAVYDAAMPYPPLAREMLDTVYGRFYGADASRERAESPDRFEWHGLMGYTPNGIRLVGVEPKNPVLLYNLGCNGIGLIPSVVGGRRIARVISGEQLSPSLFDPS